METNQSSDVTRSATCVAVLVISFCFLALAVFHSDARAERPNRLQGFSLPTTNGSVVQFAVPNVDYNVLCFLGTECPLARVYGPRLDRLSKRFADRRVRFIGVNSNIQDSMDELKQYAENHQLSFHVAKDFDRSVAMAVGATRTPEVIVVDRSGRIRYQGRIDDQYKPGIARSKPTTNDLENALTELTSGKPVTVAFTKAVGCLIALPKQQAPTASPTSITYCNEVARILQRNCTQCHRAGDIGPFALTDYDEIVGWGDMMLEVIDQGRMPPWHASPDHGEFSNARFMPQQDKQTLRKWVDAGMPYGKAADLPVAQKFNDGWRLPRQPDVVLQMNGNAFRVPADGTVEYQYFVVDPKFKEDKWIRAAELIPGNRSVVHHAIAFIRPPDGRAMRSFGLLAAYVPGQTVEELPKGYARRFEAGSKIIFQMHYTPNGREQDDKSKIGIVFADDRDVTHEVYATGGIEQEFEIPPKASNHKVSGDIRMFPRRGELLAITPHMHVRGKAFDFFVERDDQLGHVLSVPSYDFNWQHSYVLKSPMKLSDVSKMHFNAYFDNSDGNPSNPDPNEYVTWGDQTWQEMALAFLTVAEPRESESAREARLVSEQSKDRIERHRRATKQSEEFATDYIKRFDRNGDAHVSKIELPDSVRMYYFRGLDHDGDGLVSRDELQKEAYRRFKNR